MMKPAKPLESAEPMILARIRSAAAPGSFQVSVDFTELLSVNCLQPSWGWILHAAQAGAWSQLKDCGSAQSTLT